jgi:hypothetical protein
MIPLVNNFNDHQGIKCTIKPEGQQFTKHIYPFFNEFQTRNKMDYICILQLAKHRNVRIKIFSGVRVTLSVVLCVMVGRLLVGFVWLNL